MQDSEGPDSAPAATDTTATVAGAGPASGDHEQSYRAGDPVEQAALQRVMAQLIGRDYKPVRLGRFVLLEELGKGAMGVVHAGYDDTLDRRVALKLIGPARAASEPARRRLFREAQAMAKLSHANVVQVFEAGDQDGHLFIAMELVEGRTLHEWSREASRGWSEVVRMFIQIGEGLAAALAAGVVHRDFKPHNVLVGRDDRPKVADFGLATLELSLASAADSSAGLSTASGSNPSGSRELITATGEVMGTPAYMPPEQFIDRVSDAAGDQFSYCVALYEALWGQRPFAGESLSEIIANVVNRKVRVPSAGNAVPAWVRAIVLRGLSPRSRERFVSMRALIDALGDDPRVRRRRWLVRAAAATAVVCSVAAGLVVVLTRPAPCRDAGTAFEEQWGDAPRARVVEGLASTGVAYAADTTKRVIDALDGYAGRWTAGYVEACEATKVRGVQSEAAMDLRLACLRRARNGFAATLEQLATADASVVENAMRLVAALPRLGACEDLDGLRAEVRPPDDPAVAQQVVGLRSELTEAFVLQVAGRLDAAEVALRRLRQAAATLDYRPLRSNIDDVLGALLASKSERKEAEALYRSALVGALADGDDAVATRAAAGLVMLLGGHGTRFGEAQWLGEVALALAERHPNAQRVADVQTSLGALLLRQGRDDDAEAAFRIALDLLQGEHGEDHPDVAAAHENLATAMSRQGRGDEALAEQRRAVQIRETTLGPDHPMIAVGRAHIGVSLQDLGRYEEAETELLGAVAPLIRAFGAVHPEVAMVYINLGVVRDELGRHGEAQVEYRRGIEILEQTDGPDQREVAMGYNNLGTSLEDEGSLVEAEAEFRRALAISRRALGGEHLDVARTHGNLASVLIGQRRFDEAVAEAEAALTISKPALRAEHPDLLYAHRGACEAHFERAKHVAPAEPAAARRDLEVALAYCKAAGAEGETLLEAIATWRGAQTRPL